MPAGRPLEAGFGGNHRLRSRASVTCAARNLMSCMTVIQDRVFWGWALRSCERGGTQNHAQLLAGAGGARCGRRSFEFEPKFKLQTLRPNGGSVFEKP